ncbi:hypothetical protein BDP55DRAFT_723690 [Colletotrichum godetiae]|uniref:F-box domain-containing protein n=1 Tax=Colletotrichum godetiae TaxID=1209918 RepID=A0AAJ0AXF6_9PEZI|nr:uncharacterized protein BDP55DRAFT_723690 [Colletotrichum godetiae]KAK1700090.1 hypothetical protein BDP55DRAFT_723690 [Colletotrichum godetiae]
MDLKDIPNEILDLIIGQLFRLKTLGDPEKIREVRKHLLPARLVCRRWNSMATGHLYQTLELAPAKTVNDDEDEFEGWNRILDLEAARNAAQRVIIQSCHKDAKEYGDWPDWPGGRYPAFTSALQRIKQLPNLKAIELHFSEKCKGQWFQLRGYGDDVESAESRLHTLKAVFVAIRDRAVHSNPEISPIRSLTIRNLQNMAHQEFVDSALFRDVAKDIDRLHLLITEEYNEHGPDHDIFKEDRLKFEGHLHRQILPHFAANLTALTLSFHECWGTMPGYFDGAGPKLPRLKTLTLGNFVISNNHHFDWVLSQNSLETLRLDSCSIVSHINIDTEPTEKWNLHKEDWQRLPRGSYGISSGGAEIYRFDGTWEAVFDKIRHSLPYLKDFRFDNDSNGLHFLRPTRIGTVLYPSRYTNFDMGMCPSPWLLTDSATGKMEFGDNNLGSSDDSDDDDSYMNRSKETKEGDARAFNDLLSACRGRHEYLV